MPHATRQKAFGRSANTPPRFRLFLDRHLHRARRVPGRGRYRRLLADLHSHRTDAHAPGRRSPGHPVRLPSLRASPLDGLGGELHAQRSRASLLPRIPFRPRRRRDRELQAGILMGGSCILFFLLWEMFYVTEGQQRALICIPLSAAMSVGLYLLICLLPPIAVALTAVCVLPFLALLCLQKSLAEIEADATAPLTRPALRRAVGDLWRPVLCVMHPSGFRGSSSPASSRPKAPAAPRCSSVSRRRPFWWWPSSCFSRRASTSCISARCSSLRSPSCSCCRRCSGSSTRRCSWRFSCSASRW